MNDALTGVFCAAATPLDANLNPDPARLVEHCQRLLADGCTGIAMLGSTGEANSFSSAERMAMLEAVVKAGVNPDVLMPGTGLPSFPETIALTRHALSVGVTRVVMLPPFYYKGMADQGLLDSYSRVLEGIADSRLRVVLYHIPPISQVAIPHAVIRQLMDRFPGTIVGVKDSGGDLDHMSTLVEDFPGLSIFAGADPFMLPLLKKGGAGCITATSNIVGDSLRFVYDNHADAAKAADVDAAQARIVQHRNISNTFVQIPTIKAMVGHRTGDAGWSRVRPPFVALDAEQNARIGELMAAA